MRLFKIAFFDLTGEGDSAPTGRAMVYVTAPGPLDIRRIVDEQADDPNGALLDAFKGAPVKIEEEFKIPAGLDPYSVTVGIPPGGVSFCFAAQDKAHLKDVLEQALSELGHEGLSTDVRLGAWVARKIDMNTEGVW